MAIENALPSVPLATTRSRIAGWITSAEPDWDAVYRQQLPRVYNFFRYRFGSTADAEDLTSRTFEKAWTARARFRRDVAGFSTWLFTIARNVAIDHVRAQRNDAPLEAAAAIAGGTTPEDDASRQSDADRLARLLARLPERDRELLAMKFGADMTNRAIAQATGLSESNVGTIVHRAIAVLRSEWTAGAAPEGPPLQARHGE